MAFDPRSLERLKELGRRLPQPLPVPAPPPAAAAVPASERRHRVETETDPEALFHELMQVSPDGTVPPHLLQRLRQAEQQRLQSQHPQADQAPTQPKSAPPAGPAGKPLRKPSRPTELGQRDPRAAAEHPELYTAFQQLLLEGEED
jgi:hypothetical protein